jgi:predicted  nucleic acid-binding Zn-ribbon protein
LLLSERDEKRYEKLRREYFKFFEKYKAAQELLEDLAKETAPFESELKKIEDTYNVMRKKALDGEGNFEKKKLRTFAKEKMNLKKRLKRFYRKKRTLEKSQVNVEKRMNAAKKNLERFEKRVGTTLLRATINGKVSELYIKPEGTVAENTQVIKLIDDTRIRISFRITERKEFEVGTKVKLLYGQGEYYEATVLASRLPRSKHAVVDVLLPNQNKSLTEWQEAGLVRTIQDKVFALPLAAMRTNDVGQIMLYRFEGGKAVGHLIEAIEVKEDTVHFSSPHDVFAEGNEIIIESAEPEEAEKLVDGAAVQHFVDP